MKMKKLLSSIILGCMLVLTACDNFLDVVPVGSVIPSTLTEYRALLTRSYKDVSSLRDRGMACLRSYELKAKPGDYSNFDAYRDIENWNDSQANPATYSFEWERYYNIIFIANEVISAKGSIKEGTAAEINQLVGEAYMLRAYMHFTLVNLFGAPYTLDGALASKAVPLKLSNDLEKVLSRNTVEEVYKSVLADLAKARELINVEAWDENYVYRFNKSAVEALQSRISLYMGDWKECLKSSEIVMQKYDKLVDLNEADALMPNATASVENITPLEMVITSGFKYDMTVSKQFADKYSAADLRMAKYFSEADSDGNQAIAKGATNDYLCSFRTGEIYLNAAEAAAQDNQLDKARGYVLKLMKNRYPSADYTAKETAVNAMPKDKLIEEILMERDRELALEGHSWFDLRRTTRPQLVKNIGGKEYRLEHNDPRYTLQIPKEALEVNPGLRN